MESPSSNKSWIIAVVVVIAAAVILGILFIGKKPAQAPADTAPVTTTKATSATSAPHETTNPNAGSSSPAPKPTTSAPTPKPAVATYTAAQVATHNNRASCWTIVNGTVYDVTSWISHHPGGQGAIVSMCGRDASNSFNDQHGGQSRPESELASFKIGILAQ